MIIEFLLFPIWILSGFFTRDKNTLIFGSWFGERYNDNPRYLFEFLVKKKELNCIWISKNDSIVNHLRKNNYKCFKPFSLYGIYYSLKAGYAFIGSGKKDLNPYFIRGCTIINLWHGAPLKKIGILNNKIKFQKFKNVFRKYLMPASFEYNIDFVVSTSEEFDKILADSFNLNFNQILKVGYPRNNNLIKEYQKKPIDIAFKKIAYLPTFRDNHPEYDLFRFDFNLLKLERFLKKNKSILYIGSHFASNQKSEFNTCKNIKSIDSNYHFNINDFLCEIDILITD